MRPRISLSYRMRAVPPHRLRVGRGRDRTGLEFDVTQPTCSTVDCLGPCYGLMDVCHPCYRRAYYLANRERMHAQARAYSAAKPSASNLTSVTARLLPVA